MRHCSSYLLHPWTRWSLALLCVLPAQVARATQGPLASRAVPATVRLRAPLRYEQMDSASCEAAAVHIALHMRGVDVSERHLIAALPVDRRPPGVGPDGAVVAWGDPYRAFVGDITRGDHWPLVGYGVYAPPILSLVRHPSCLSCDARGWAARLAAPASPWARCAMLSPQASR